MRFDSFTLSLIVSLVLLCIATFFFGLGEFSNSLVKDNNQNSGYFESCSNNRCGKNSNGISLALTLIGFLLVVHSAIFSLLSIIFQHRIPRNDHFKILIAVLVYDILAVIFMIVGWNEFRLATSYNSHGWSYYMLIVGFVIAIIALVAIIISLILCYRYW